MIIEYLTDNEKSLRFSKTEAKCKYILSIFRVIAICNGFVDSARYCVIYGNSEEDQPAGMPEAMRHTYEKIDASGENRISKWIKSSFVYTSYNAIINGYRTEQDPRDPPGVSKCSEEEEGYSCDYRIGE